MRKWLRWQEGRRKTGYSKMKFWELKFGKLFATDFYLLKFPKGASAPEHHDTITGYRHFRCNFIVRQSGSGGEFRAAHSFYNGRRLKIFRSDHTHEVTEVKEGTRYVFSLGLAVREHKI